jgi:TonB family protein
MVPKLFLVITIILSTLGSAFAQSGAAGNRSAYRDYGVNLTFAVYQYDAARSPSLEEITRLASTFSTPEQEIAYLKEKHKLDEVAVRHIRSVGLRSGETFNDAALLGPEYMVFAMTVRDTVRGYTKLDFKVRYANEPMLETKGVELENYETVLLRGGKGMFGVKYFIGAGGTQEAVPAERTLLISVTPEIVPVASLRNRPEQLSHPVDEYGAPLKMAESDRFTPPIPTERVVPKFETGRAVRGSVLVAGVITPDGRVINTKVLRGIDRQIDERALEAFRGYRFSPALLNGKAVHATYREEISFASPLPTILELQEEERKRREAAEREKRKKP